MKRIFITAIIASLTACSGSKPEWRHGTKNSQQYHTDSSRCLALAGVGQANQVVDSRNPLIQGQNQGAALQAQSNQTLVFEQCMLGNGWYRGSAPSLTKLSLDRYAKSMQWPDVGSIITANVGERVSYAVRKSMPPALTVPVDQSIEYDESDRWALVTTIKAGTYIAAFEDSAGGTYFRPAELLPWRYKSRRPSVADREIEFHAGGIYVSPTGENFVYYHWQGLSEPTDKYPAPQLRTLRTIAEIDLPTATKQVELLYLGISQGAVVLRFREYWNDGSRPEFSQEVKYEIHQSRQIAYRDAKFDVLEATSASIRLRTIGTLKLN